MGKYIMTLGGDVAHVESTDDGLFRHIEYGVALTLDGWLDAGWAIRKDFGFPPHALEEIKNGRKIQAIKEYRGATGASLAEAKKAVEDYARDNGWTLGSGL